MSLHRVSSMGSYEHVRGSSPARSESRKMSLNPVGMSLPTAAKEEPIGAFEVPKPKRILQVAVAVVYCLFSAGVVFGYAAIKPVFVKEGVYSELCSSEAFTASETTCYQQEIRLNLMFTTAAVATNVCALPVGTLLDRYGPRVCGIIGSILLAIGAIFLALASNVPFDAYIPGYLFLALGGPFVFISSFQLSNTFPNHAGLILALLTGAFDSSSAIFLFYRLAYAASNETFTPQKFFLVYLIVPAFLLVAQIFLMPARSYKTVGELVSQAENPDNDVDTRDWDDRDQGEVAQIREERRAHRESVISEVTSLLGNKGATKQQNEEEKRKAISGVYGAQHGRTAFQQIRSPWFILITGFTVVQMTRINYFVATIRTQYEYMLRDEAKAEQVNNIFDVALPVGGILSIPFIGLVLDNTSTTFVLGLLVSVATTIGILGVIPYLWAAYANIVLFTLYRPFYYTAVSDYAAKVFGFHTFGKVYGLIICLAGILNFVQSALDAATHEVFNSDPIPINVILIVVAVVVGAALVGYVWHKSRTLARDRLEEEAETATEPYQPPRGATASEPAIDPRTYSSRTNINQQGSSAQYYSSPLPQTNNTTARYPTPDAITQRPAPQGYSESQYQNIAPYFGQSQAHIPDYHQQQTLTFLEPHQPNMASNPPTSSGTNSAFSSPAKPAGTHSRRAVACKSCRAAKCRCEVDPGNTQCNRCIKEGKPCDMSRPSATSRADQRVIDLEQQVVGLEQQVIGLEDKVTGLEETIGELKQQFTAFTKENA